MNIHPKKFMRKKITIILGATVCIIFMLLAGELAYYRAQLGTTPVKTAAVINTRPLPKKVLPPETNYCEDNHESKLLLVSISKQHMWACAGMSLEKESAVTTGITVNPSGVDDNTPVGTWKIYSKQTNLHLRGRDANGSWDDPVQYWMPFNDQVGFHDASWQTFPYGSEEYHINGSHGCVHLPIEMMSWVYEWAPVGTTVTVKA